MLISFLIPSRNPNLLNRFFNYLESNTKNLSQIEVLIKLDNDEDYQKFIKNSKKRPFKIKFFVTPRLEGQPSLWFAVEKLFFECNKNSYFVQILSDEPYIVTKNWDEKLKNYKFFFKDSVFRLRTSKLKYFNYSNYFDCVTKPDSYPIYTRKWLELTIGPGNCWGSDAYQQLISYFLALGPFNHLNLSRMGSVSRDIPVNDIKYKGLEWGVNVNSEYKKYMRNYMIWEWRRLCSKKNLIEISYKAMRMYTYILAKEWGVQKFQILRDGNKIKLQAKNRIYLYLDFTLNKNLNPHNIILKTLYLSNVIKQKFLDFYLLIIIFINFKPFNYLFLKRINRLIIKLFSYTFFKKDNKSEIKSFLKFKSSNFPTAPNLNYINNISKLLPSYNVKFDTPLPGMNFKKVYNNIKRPGKIPNVTIEDKVWFDIESINHDNERKKLEEKIF